MEGCGHQDFKTVVVGKRRGGGGGGAPTGPAVATRKEFSGGTNAQKSGLGQQARKLADATGEDGFRHEKVSLDLKLRIMKARQAKGMTQKELAQKIGEKPQVVNQMEAGKTVPNNQILGKMERALGVKLRGAPGPLGGGKKKKKK